jgi:hypothetical protein
MEELHMKTAMKFVLLVCALLLLPAASAADEARVTLYTGSGADNCNLYDTGPALHEVYVVYTGPTSVMALEFKLEQTYDAGLTYLGETIIQPRTLTAGRADKGVAVALGECLAGSNLQVLKVIYQGLGVSASCSQLRVLRNPESTHVNGNKIACVDCSTPYSQIFWAEPGHLVINPDDDCECESPGSGGPSPVAATTWGGIKALYVE